MSYEPNSEYADMARNLKAKIASEIEAKAVEEIRILCGEDKPFSPGEKLNRIVQITTQASRAVSDFLPPKSATRGG